MLLEYSLSDISCRGGGTEVGSGGSTGGGIEGGTGGGGVRGRDGVDGEGDGSCGAGGRPDVLLHRKASVRYLDSNRQPVCLPAHGSSSPLCRVTDPPVLFAVSRSLQSSLPCHGPSSPIPEGRPPVTSYLIPSPLWPHVLDLKVNPSSEDECLAPRRS